jgi:hypothetical protein
MNYRQLQRNLKALRSQGVIPKSFKLNQKAAILRDALVKYTRASDLFSYKLVPNVAEGTVTIVVNNIIEGLKLDTSKSNYIKGFTFVKGAQYHVSPRKYWHYVAELQSILSTEIQTALQAAI